MKNYLIRKKRLFDGDQDQFVVNSWKINCCICNGKIEFGVADCKSILHLDRENLEKVLSEVKNIESKSLGDTTFYKIEGLPVNFFKLKCPSCGATNLGIVGLGEYQPARYMTVIVGLVGL